jgi:hypothetical protein
MTLPPILVKSEQTLHVCNVLNLYNMSLVVWVHITCEVAAGGEHII